MNTDPQSHQQNVTRDSSSNPPVVLNDLFERCMRRADIVAIVLDKFEQQMSDDLREIEDRLGSRDTDQIARIAHSLKGSAGAASASAVRDVAAEIELLSRNARIDAITCELEHLKNEIARCIAYLPEARSDLQSMTNRASQKKGDIA